MTVRPGGNVLRILHSLGDPHTAPGARSRPEPAEGPRPGVSPDLVEGPAEGAVLIITVGLPATGKSTFARRLAGMTGAVVLESDAIRRLLHDPPTYSPRESFGLFRSIHAAARRLLEAGRPVIVDATSITEAHRRPLYALAEAAGVPLIIAQFQAPAGVVEGRLARRAAGRDIGDSSEAGPDVYQRMAPRFEPVRRSHWQIDTSDPAATEAALAEMAEACRVLILSKGRRATEPHGQGEGSR